MALEAGDPPGMDNGEGPAVVQRTGPVIAVHAEVRGDQLRSRNEEYNQHDGEDNAYTNHVLGVSKSIAHGGLSEYRIGRR
jgi:hypothetical protein